MSGFDYMDCRLCVEQLTKAIGNRSAAVELLSEALVGGEVNAIGRNSSGRLTPIPMSFWRSVASDPEAICSWIAGAFELPPRADYALADTVFSLTYRSVQLDAEMVKALAPLVIGTETEEAEPRVGRPRGTGYVIKDTPFANEINDLVRQQRFPSHTQAALDVVKRESGIPGTSTDRKVDRLVRLAKKLREQADRE